jgi:CRP-like cAMP-binding protein
MSHPVLSRCPLFAGIAADEITPLLECLGARRVAVEKNQTIFWEGDAASDMGIVLEGAVQVVRDDYYGNRTIVARLEAASLFAEAFACAGIASYPVSVIAETACTVLILNCQRIMTICSSSCGFHSRLIRNLLAIVASKTIQLNQKLELLSHRSIRERLMHYLLGCAKKAGESQFTIPYDRQQLANYLCVERSALSAEISKLQKEGILESRRSWFMLKSESWKG